MRVAAIQFKPPKFRPDDARAALASLVTEAAEDGAEVIVCPEMAIQGYVWPSADAIRPLAEAARGPTFATFSGIAAQHKAWITVGFAEIFEDALYNSALVIGPDGSLVTTYRKVLLYTLDEQWAERGNRRVAIDTGSALSAIGICMDLNDEGFRRFLGEHQPEHLWFLTNWVEEGIDVLQYWRRRIFPWSGVMIAANTWGFDGDVEFSGRSLIWSAGGDILCRAPRHGNHVLIADV
jgi:predicted amidohydrolase